MRSSEHDVARAYVLYREKRSQERAQSTPAPAATDQTIIHVTDNGVQCPLDLARLRATITEAGLNLPHNIATEAILKETVKHINGGIPVAAVFKSAIMSARASVEHRQYYTQVRASKPPQHTRKKDRA